MWHVRAFFFFVFFLVFGFWFFVFHIYFLLFLCSILHVYPLRLLSLSLISWLGAKVQRYLVVATMKSCTLFFFSVSNHFSPPLPSLLHPTALLVLALFAAPVFGAECTATCDDCSSCDINCQDEPNEWKGCNASQPVKGFFCGGGYETRTYTTTIEQANNGSFCEHTEADLTRECGWNRCPAFGDCLRPKTDYVIAYPDQNTDSEQYGGMILASTYSVVYIPFFFPHLN